MSSQWRNVLCDDAEPDVRMREIDAEEERLGGVSEPARHVRALISRFDSVTHYRALDNLKLIIDAIAALDYPGRPAVDVLTRAWEIDPERSEQFRAVAKALKAVAHGDTPGASIPAVDSLGDLTPEQRWLAASLAHTVSVFVRRPEDEVEDMGDEEFVVGVYESALGRRPSADDLATRIGELRAGKSRAEFMREILQSDESVSRGLHSVAHHGGGQVS